MAFDLTQRAFERFYMSLVYIAHGNHEYSRLFLDLGFKLCDDASAADLICFTGGADVSPSFYGDLKHRTTHNDLWRDENEKHLFETALEYSIPMVGICRGGQFLNVMSGGRMYQDVTGHTRSHSITDKFTGEVVYVSSTHHQMIMPSERCEIVATSTDVHSKREWYDQEVFRHDETDEGIEVVYYPTTNALCFQPHPEFKSVEYVGMQKYFRSLLKRYLEI